MCWHEKAEQFNPALAITCPDFRERQPLGARLKREKANKNYMTKLYKYRPLSDFLFKELYYHELYFSSYFELNDPLDLSARIDFTPKKSKQIDSIFWFLFKTTLKIRERDGEPTEKININNKQLILFHRNEDLKNTYKTKIFDKLTQLSKRKDFISFEDLETILFLSFKDLPFEYDFSGFRNEIERLTRKFLENSYTTCFSENNNDFLMWSHYASKHSGICLEFTLEKDGLFPYIYTASRKPNREEYLKGLSDWKIDETIFWESIKKVNYQIKQPHINFFDFTPVFCNEYNCDLIGLSKSWTHKFAYELEIAFSTKTLSWKYEKEWRAIEVNFGEKKEPEERIHHYPIECLTAIYFGVRTPDTVKKRIFKLFNHQDSQSINYFDCITTSGRKLKFVEWVNDEALD